MHSVLSFKQRCPLLGGLFVLKSSIHACHVVQIRGVLIQTVCYTHACNMKDICNVQTQELCDKYFKTELATD